ncbi:MAG: SIR2 family protein [Chloroflexota bacterium]
MQFIENGPDIPDDLLEAHEQGRVVFFCGAGVSYPAGLPSFRRLTQLIIAEIGATLNSTQQAAFDADRFDTVLDLLERDKPDGHMKVRKALVKSLIPDLTRPGAMDTHRALLTLGTTRKKQVRIVTTNFDRLFEMVLEERGQDIERCRAPLLPVPKTRLDSVVYLHGLIENSPKEEMLHRLVLTSGDFGRAYLNERWAAVFVSELFRNFKVVFVGYSLEDPVMRYMMDALAGDKLLGETTIEMYAFVPHVASGEKDAERDWRSKNVTPILYLDDEEHARLHRTLKEWADTYRDGLHGKEMVLRQHCVSKPASNSRYDFAVGRVVWALTNAESDNHLAARYFAGMDPVPPFEWLGPLEEGQFHHGDLTRFGIAPEDHRDDKHKLVFSFLRRPTSYRRAPWMNLVNMGPHYGGYDGVMYQMGRWLIRHLSNPKLLFWCAKWGGRLHDGFEGTVRAHLSSVDKLQFEGPVTELDELKRLSPDAIPSDPLRILWDLMLEGRIRGSHAQSADLYSWRSKFKKEGMTPALLPELRELLTPCIRISEPIAWPWLEKKGEQTEGPKTVRDVAECEIVLASGHVHIALRDIFKSEEWKALSVEFLPTASVMLKDAMDLQRMLQRAGERSDASYVYQPSISKHRQNRDFRDWTVLIDMCRDGWLNLAEKDPEAALAWATLWFKTPYPVFKRLAFFAAAQPNTPISVETALAWLTTEDTYWFWTVETQREVMRLVVALAPKLDPNQRARFEQIALKGPPRSLYKADISEERWQQAWTNETWHVLAKFRSAAALGPEAQKKLDEIQAAYPTLALEPDEDRDEFSMWMHTGGRTSTKVATPRECVELRQWLKVHPKTGQRFDEEDDWGDRCRSDVAVTIWVLQDLARDGIYPVDRWREAIHAWDQDKMLLRMWRLMSRHVLALPNPEFNELAVTLAQWVKDLAKVFDSKETRFFALCERLLAYDDGKETAKKDVITEALNHPIGESTEALMIWWYRQKLQDKSVLDPRIGLTFTKLADTSVARYRPARIFLAQNAVTLFRVDEQWTREHVLPLFDWAQNRGCLRFCVNGLMVDPG